MTIYGATLRQVACVDRTNGSSFGSGSLRNPSNTLAIAAMILGENGGGRIVVRASEADPLPRVSLFNAAEISIEPWDDGPFYVTTPGDPAIWAQGTGLVTVTGGILSGHYGARVGADGGSEAYLDLIDCTCNGTESGVHTVWVWTALNCLRCVGYGAANDGFNIHGDAGVTGVATLTDCTATGCGDEGASPHDDVVLHVIGGNYSGNVGGGGVTAVNNAEMHVSGGAVFDGNCTGGAKVNQGGISFFDATCTGSVDGAVVTGNTGPGCYVAPGAAVTVANLTSTGNTEPDVLP